MEIVFYIGVIIGLCGLIMCIWNLAKNIMQQDAAKAIVFGIGCAVCLVISVMSLSINSGYKTQRYNEAVAKNYVVYVDGTEVDPKGIDVTEYKCVIDDDLKVVKLTKIVRGRGSTYVPYVPYVPANY